MGIASANDVTQRKRAEDLGFWKSQLVELSLGLPREKTVDFRLLAEALDRGRTKLGGGKMKKPE